MALEFSIALKALDEHIAVLKQELLFAMAEREPDKRIVSQEIITIKRELDKAVQERMKLSQIYYLPTHNKSTDSSVTASA